MAIIEYKQEKVFTAELEIDDIGNVCVRATNEEKGEDYYINVQSLSGFAYIFKLGPVCPDIEVALDGLEISYKQIKFSDKTISKEISLYINDPKKGISIAEIVDFQEALNAIPTKEMFVAI